MLATGKIRRTDISDILFYSVGLGRVHVRIDLLGLVDGFPLYLESAQKSRGLRGQANMAEHRYAGAVNRRNGLSHILTAFQLDRIGNAVFVENTRIGHRLLDGDIIGHEGHIGYNMCSLHSPGYRFGVGQHLLHGDRYGIPVTQLDHAKRVPDQNHIDPRLIHDHTLGVGVGGDHRDLGPFFLHSPEIGYHHFLGFFDCFAHRSGPSM